MTEPMAIGAQAVERLVVNMERDGFAVLEGFVSPELLQQGRDYVRQQVARSDGESFSIHGQEAMAGSPFANLSASAEFRELLAEIYRAGMGQRPSDSGDIFPVIRCLQGESAREHSHYFHFDATVLTVLVPVFMPTEGTDRGDLVLFRNNRKVRSNVILNIVEKALLQNQLSQKLIVQLIRRGLLKPLKLRLVPGNIYFFWGYRNLHSNDPCAPDQLRTTVLYHFVNPHRNNLMARLLLGRNQRHHRLMSAEGLRNAWQMLRKPT